MIRTDRRCRASHGAPAFQGGRGGEGGPPKEDPEGRLAGEGTQVSFFRSSCCCLRCGGEMAGWCLSVID